MKKALDVAEKNNLTDEIRKIRNLLEQPTESEKSPEENDIEVTISNFISAGYPEKALPLLIKSNQADRALEICIQHNVPITDDLMNKMVPSEQNQSEEAQNKRKDMLNKIGDHVKKQGNFALASQIFIKISEKIKAMKCLINLGEIEKVITFANNARIPDIYILAGNFLQTAEWD